MLHVYKASAGSGKTYRLALEYLTAALGSEDPGEFRHILAVTFTNKATGEMKDRILAYLFDLARGTGDLNFAASLAHETGLAPSLLAARAEALLKAILHDYDNFRVQTIDAFFQAVLANMSYELGLMRGFRIDLADKEIIAKAVDKLLAQTNPEKGCADEKKLMESLVAYMEEHIEDEQGWNISKSLKSFAGSNLFRDTYLRHEREIRKVTDDPQKMNDLRRCLRAAEKEETEKLHQEALAFQKMLQELPFDYTAFSRGKSLMTYASKIADGDFITEPSATLLKNMEDSSTLVKKADAKNGDMLTTAETVSEKLGGLEQKRRNAALTLTSIRLTLQLLSPLTLLTHVDAEVEAANRTAGHFMLAKTPVLLGNMVKGSDASFIYERIGTTLRHVMIDEFQDTSQMQWDNFRMLLDELVASGQKCVVVGDIKQSIYRWRGGSWNILSALGPNSKPPAAVFNTKGQSLDAPAKEGEMPCDTNFRSLPNVVDFNNVFFQLAAAHLDEQWKKSGATKPLNMAKLYADVVQEPRGGRKGGLVSVCLPPSSMSSEAVLEHLHAFMTDLHENQGVPYGKMGILVRYNNEAAFVASHFSVHHPDVPVSSDEAYHLLSSPAVLMLVAALKWIANEERALQQAVFNRQCELLLLPSHDLSELADESLKDMPLFELCSNLAERFGLSEDTPERAAHGQSAYLFAFFDQVLEFLCEHSSDITRFCAWCDENLASKSVPSNTENSDAVRICTIHKSKGLQFHTVFMPFADWAMETRRPEDVLWCTPPKELSPFNQLPSVPVGTYASKTVTASIYAEDYLTEIAQQHIDNLNLLYVAFTRAVAHLCIWGTPRKKGGDMATLMAEILPETGLEQVELENIFECCEEEAPEEDDDTTDNDEEQKTPEPILCFLSGEPVKWEEKTKEQSANPFGENSLPVLPVALQPKAPQVTLLQSNAARTFAENLKGAAENGDGESPANDMAFGAACHRILENVRTADDLEKAVRAARDEGLFARRSEAEHIQKLLAKRIAAPHARRWFDGTYELYNECAILFRDAAGRPVSRRPDRVMVKEKEAVVVDYKFARPTEAHRRQVAQYVELLRRMGYEKVSGFVWYVLHDELRAV